MAVLEEPAGTGVVLAASTSGLAPGIYFYRAVILAGGVTQITEFKKLAIVKDK